MTVLKVEDMHCGKCVERIERALTKERIEHNVNLPEKTVTIDDHENGIKRVVEILDELGFEAVIV